MALANLKFFLPNHPVRTPILFGPFRGARIVLNPRCSLRKILGFYEHELNPWLKQTLRRVTRVLDVGANDGYFTIGCAAAFRRQGKSGEIIGFEPQEQHLRTLRQSVAAQGSTDIRFDIIPAFVGCEVRKGMITLDALSLTDRLHTLVKIDVEGAEVDVVQGSRTWMTPSNYFLIEVHQRRFLDLLRKMFAARGHELRQIDQRPLPLLGREVRHEENCWLVSDLGRGRLAPASSTKARAEIEVV
jgi:hypothetical protein